MRKHFRHSINAKITKIDIKNVAWLCGITCATVSGACTKALETIHLALGVIADLKSKKELCHYKNFTINLESWTIEIGGSGGFPSFYKCRVSQV